MLLDLRELLVTPGDALPFEVSLEYTAEDTHEVRHFPTPVLVKGSAKNQAGIVTLGYLAMFTLNTQCDRCLSFVTAPITAEFEHTITDERAAEDSLPYNDGVLDLKLLAFGDVLLVLPTKHLCSDDCKGLCQICGTNLNEHTCGCITKQVDPRLQVLLGLLDDPEE